MNVGFRANEFVKCVLALLLVESGESLLRMIDTAWHVPLTSYHFTHIVAVG